MQASLTSGIAYAVQIGTRAMARAARWTERRRAIQATKARSTMARAVEAFASRWLTARCTHGLGAISPGETSVARALRTREGEGRCGARHATEWRSVPPRTIAHLRAMARGQGLRTACLLQHRMLAPAPHTCSSTAYLLLLLTARSLYHHRLAESVPWRQTGTRRCHGTDWGMQISSNRRPRSPLRSSTRLPRTLHADCTRKGKPAASNLHPRIQGRSSTARPRNIHGVKRTSENTPAVSSRAQPLHAKRGRAACASNGCVRG